MKYSESNMPIVCMMTQSTCYKGTSTMKPLGVLWHSTGANNPTLKRYVQPDDNAPNRAEMIALIGKNQYNNDFNHITRQAGLNAWIGKLADGTVATIQVMPWNYKPWGCGKGSKGTCNNGWMQFEICEDGLTDKDYFNAVYKEACELTAYYCKMYNLDPRGTVQYNGVTVPVILDHKTSCDLNLGSNHGDVQHWFKKHGKTLDDVRNDVAKLLAEDGSAPSTPETIPTVPATEEMYRVRKSWEDSQSQKGAYRNLDNAKKECDKAGAEYKVYNSKGEQVYPEVKVEVKPDTSKVDTSAIDQKKMWDYFLKSGMNEYGVAGVMGNLYAESALRPCNLQQTYEKSLGMSDAEYTAAVDAGVYTNFVKDSAGYGLAQWTYWSLKQDMLAYHQNKGKSIGDGDTQMEFLVHQLSTQYTAVWKVLTSAKSVREASDAMLLKFERPADQSEAVQKKRAEYGQKYFDQYTEKKAEETVSGIVKGDLVSLAPNATYYSGKDIPAWVEKQNWYVKDVSGDRAVIDKSEDGKSSINSPVNVKYLIKVIKEESQPTPTPVPTPVPVEKITLRRGDKNDSVKLLQTRLKELGFDCNGIDGSFGPETEKQVKAFQVERGLSDDGICGPKTWAAIDSFKEYDVIVNVNLLNIRTGPSSTKYKVKSTTRKGARYTIVYKKGSWGKIKNGAGWFYLPYVKQA